MQAGPNTINWTLPHDAAVSDNYTVRVCYTAGLKQDIKCNDSNPFSITGLLVYDAHLRRKGVEPTPVLKIIAIVLSILGFILICSIIVILYIRSSVKTRKFSYIARKVDMLGKI